MKIKLAVFFGGKSVEHEISIISAVQAMAALDKEKYDVIPVIIAEALKNLSDLKIKLKLSEEDYEYFLDAAHTLIDMSLSSAFHGLTLCLTYNNHKEVCDYIKDFCEKIDPIIGTYDSQLKEDFNLNEMLGLESEDNAE